MMALKLLYWLFGVPVLVMVGCAFWVLMLSWGTMAVSNIWHGE